VVSAARCRKLKQVVGNKVGPIVYPDAGQQLHVARHAGFFRPVARKDAYERVRRYLAARLRKH
jgi:hypothetical protein